MRIILRLQPHYILVEKWNTSYVLWVPMNKLLVEMYGLQVQFYKLQVQTHKLEH